MKSKVDQPVYSKLNCRVGSGGLISAVAWTNPPLLHVGAHRFSTLDRHPCVLRADIQEHQQIASIETYMKAQHHQRPQEMAVAVSQPAWFVTLPSAETQKLGVIEDTMNYGERLFHYTYATRHDDVHFLAYRTLHRYNIFHLQNQLAKLKGSCWTKRDVTDATLGDLKNTLHEYSKYLNFNMLT